MVDLLVALLTVPGVAHWVTYHLSLVITGWEATL